MNFHRKNYLFFYYFFVLGIIWGRFRHPKSILIDRKIENSLKMHFCFDFVIEILIENRFFDKNDHLHRITVPRLLNKRETAISIIPRVWPYQSTSFSRRIAWLGPRIRSSTLWMMSTLRKGGGGLEGVRGGPGGQKHDIPKVRPHHST